MPALHIILNSEETAFDALAALVQRTGKSAEELFESGELIYMQEDAHIEVGGLPRGTQSGKPVVSFCFGLPDGRVVLAETTMQLFFAAADALKSAYGDPRDGMPQGSQN